MVAVTVLVAVLITVTAFGLGGDVDIAAVDMAAVGVDRYPLRGADRDGAGFDCGCGCRRTGRGDFGWRRGRFGAATCTQKRHRSNASR